MDTGMGCGTAEGRPLVSRAKTASWWLLVSLCSVFGPATAHAAPEKKVFPGQEIVVSFKPPEKGVSVRAKQHVASLKMPSSLRLHQALDQGSIGIVSLSSTSAAFAQEPISISDAEVARRCDEIISQNKNLPIICEANTVFSISLAPNDPSYSSQYGLSKISAPNAWDISTGSYDVLVAVLDTGVDYTHPDLADNIAVNSDEIPDNYLDDDGNGFIDDYYGVNFISYNGNPMDDHYHGTHCAGILGAVGNNGVGVSGVAWEVSILPVKVLNSSGSGSLGGIAAGINYAVTRGAKVLSMSLGGGSTSATLNAAIEAARVNGVLIVAAAGNSGANIDTSPVYPAASTSANILAVAATDSSDGRPSYSNYGPTSVDVSAPGDAVLSTLPSNDYNTLSGTSMAAPHVSGIAAVMLAINPQLTVADIKTILINTSDPIAAMSGKSVSQGRVNFYSAALGAFNSITPTPTPTATFTPTPTFTSTPSNTPTPTNSPIHTSTPITTGTAQPDIPTASPTPTPSSMPEPDPTGEPVDELQISVRLDRMRRTAYVYGEVTQLDSEEPVSGLEVLLMCDGKERRRDTTDTDGYFEFSIRRPARAISCFVRDSAGNRSRRLRFR